MYVIAPISSSRLTSSVIRLSWPIASARVIQSRRSLGPKPCGLAPRWAAAGVPGETLISSMGSASAESIRCGERERKPPPRLLLERILDRTPAASRQASPRHVEIDRVLLLALVPILVELGLPVLRMERVAVVARAPGQEHQRTEKCEPCNRHRAPLLTSESTRRGGRE